MEMKTADLAESNFAESGIKEMKSTDRRKKIIEILAISNAPVSASNLAEKLSVSRQIIVNDVALLRASGKEIESTPRGYIVKDNNDSDFPYIGIIACRHDFKLLKEELYTIVDFGGVVIDVSVEHPLYGELSGMLNISSRFEVDLFIKRVSSESAKPLSTLTGGVHLHRIGCSDKEIFEMIKESLIKKEIVIDG